MSRKPEDPRLNDSGPPRGPGPEGPGGPMGLPPEWSALEAALAGLVPRADGLDPDQILFLAGRASAAGPSRRRWPLRALQAWAAGMTAAAVLLAVLLVRAERRLERTSQSGPAPGRESVVDQASEQGPSPPELPRHRTSPLRVGPAQPAPTPAQPLIPATARAGRTVPPPGDWTRYGSRSEYVVMLDRLLRAGADVGPALGNVSGPADRKDETVLSYGQWLEILLDDQAQGRAPGGGTEMPSTTGAKS